MLTEAITVPKEYNDMDLTYSVVTYAGNSVLNDSLDYNSLLYLGYYEPFLYRDPLDTL